MTANPQALHLQDALQIDEARHACQAIAGQRRAARDQLSAALERLANREREYRKARAVAYVEHASAPSAGMRDAMVDEATADARYERDVAKGMVEAAEQLLSQIDAERASLHRLIDWSARLDPYATEGQREPVRRVA